MSLQQVVPVKKNSRIIPDSDHSSSTGSTGKKKKSRIIPDPDHSSSTRPGSQKHYRTRITAAVPVVPVPESKQQHRYLPQKSPTRITAVPLVPVKKNPQAGRIPGSATSVSVPARKIPDPDHSCAGIWWD